MSIISYLVRISAEREQLKAELDSILEPVMEVALDQIEIRTSMDSEGDPEVIGGINSFEVTEITGPDYITFDIENDMNIPTSFNGIKDGVDFKCILFEIVKGEAHYEVTT